MKWLTLVAASAVAVLLVGCGTATTPPGDQPGADRSTATSRSSVSSHVVDPSEELVAHGILMQRLPDGDVEICIGGVAESLPPQCGGPVLEGEFSWDDVDARSQDGVTWTDESYYAVGRYAAGSEHGQVVGAEWTFGGTITLTRPVSADPPDGFSPPVADDIGFPQLCDDPTADVPDVDQAARAQGAHASDEQEALQQRVQTLDGYVTSWLSDGGPLMNVVVTSGPQEARAALREVFHGPLCVVQRDLPAEQDVLAAIEALGTQDEELQLLSVATGGVTGVPSVNVVLADRGTVDRVLEIVEPWLTPDQLTIWSALRSLDAEDHG